MSKGVKAIILLSLAGAAIFSGIVISIIYLFFIGLIYSFLAIIAGGLMLAVILMFLLIFILSAFTFFAMIYYMAEKKPTIIPGNYNLEEEKGKREK